MKRFLTILFITIFLLIFLIFITGCTNDNAQGERKVLRVGMECSYAPYNWAQPDNSNGAVPIKDSTDYAYGYDVMMAKYLANELRL